jgi:hypothetical protein
MRGVFLRGVSGTRTDKLEDPGDDLRENVIPGGNTGNYVGSTQSDALRTHTHRLESWSGQSPNGSENPNNAGYGAGGPYGTAIITKGPVEPSFAVSEFETRPRNVAVNYIIKF